MLLERAVKERSEWQDMAIAILKGEAMSPRNPWWRPSRCLYDWEWLRARFDRDADERVGRAELAGAEELFARLDRDADGALAAADLDPAAAAVSRPEVEALFRFLDHDANHKVSWDELSWFFQQADRRKRGFLSPEDLQAVLAPALLDGEKKREGEEKEAMPSRRRLLSLLLRGELGSFAPGPELGQAAPEIRLPRHRGGDGEPPPVLAEHRGRRPVVLIFGSFT
jgi:Ca2+-binding EF-hand superfamily protein